MSLYMKMKRIFDIIVAIIACVILIIPWIIISVVIKIQSPGPVIYKARRVGLNGEIFTLYKFRSMCVDSGSIHATTLRNDSRIFPFGKILRKSKLDETPQFVNILLGQMSLVGPRPEDEDNSKKFYVGEFERILSVRPGLSSPASLYDYTHGELYEDEESYINKFLPKKLAVELYYIKNMSICYDLQIIVRTIVTIIQIMIGIREFKEPKEVDLCMKEKKQYC